MSLPSLAVVKDVHTYTRLVPLVPGRRGLGHRVRLQFPSLTALNVRGSPRGRARGRGGNAFLYHRGEQWCLILALTLEGRRAHHEDLIEREEPGRLGRDWHLHSLGDQRIYLFEGKGWVRFAFADLRASVLASMWRLAGPPEDEGAWLAGKLLPRRVPAVARLTGGRHLQLWSFL